MPADSEKQGQFENTLTPKFEEPEQVFCELKNAPTYFFLRGFDIKRQGCPTDSAHLHQTGRQCRPDRHPHHNQAQSGHQLPRGESHIRRRADGDLRRQENRRHFSSQAQRKGSADSQSG